ncbi:PPPDE putative peptidase domain-containing protein [Phyllosticta citrichinensis]|uniref:PPPDE putative peptidase domain-containing protein n=1 Tax=Phyllosticta citrichinensis TaxID=1130410 RepID=A0ABR1XJJ9_9PEZI
MDVELYVYDLSKLSRQFLGIHIEAVYHTSIVFGGIEYFYGAGVQTCYPGTTHHGAPEEIIPLGKTQLEMGDILEYLESLKKIYTPETYDLFAHNCNNFSNDFAMFLVGKGIPDKITSLPEQVLQTPFGQMLKPQIDAAMRSVTQAPVPPQNIPGSQSQSQAPAEKASNGAAAESGIHDVTSLKEFEKLLEKAKDLSAVVFFTSSTCGPCKSITPAFSEMAEEAGSKGIFIRVDKSQAPDIHARYNVRLTPTIITFLKGMKDDQWSGADETRLRGNVRLLLQQANIAHPHTRLDLPKLLGSSMRPVIYDKVPPLEKLVPKMGGHGKHPIVVMITAFIKTRESSGSRDAPLPALPDFCSFLREAVAAIPPESLFAAYDLLRIALTDPRLSGFFAEETNAETLIKLVSHVNDLKDCPYSLRLVTLQLACNLFTTPLTRTHLLSNATFTSLLTHLLSSSLLDDSNTSVRIAAASLAFNIASAVHRSRLDTDSADALPESDQTEIVAALLEAIAAEEVSKEAVLGMVTALGLLVYCAPVDGELLDLCRAMDASGTVVGKEAMFAEKQDEEGRGVVVEVGKRVLGKGVEN